MVFILYIFLLQNKPMSGAERQKKWRKDHPEYRNREKLRGRERRAADPPERIQREQARLRQAKMRERQREGRRAAQQAADQAE